MFHVLHLGFAFHTFSLFAKAEFNNAGNNITMNDSERACTVLSSLLKDKVSYPGSSTYKSVEDAYFSAQEEELSPACIVAPTSPDDVATAIKALAGLRVKFAVRGGGHSLNAGAANIDSGITISLRSMNQVNVNADKTLVSVGGGAKWGEVYPPLVTFGIATSGGRVADVGVGGLSTGGGISYFSARQGLVCDNIENFEVVLSDGRILNANRDENSDLWVALKGGSSNFGIVTRFDIRTFPQGDFYGGVVGSSISTISEQLNGFANLLNNFDPDAAIIMSISWNQVRGSFSIFSNLEYTKAVENPPSLQPFLQAQPQFINTMRISNLADFTVEAGKYAKPGLRNQFATTTFGGSLSMLNTVYNIWKTSVSTIASVQGINWAMSIQPFPPAFSSETVRLGGNSLGLDPSDGPLVLFLLSYNWANAVDDQAVDTAAQSLLAAIDTAARNAGMYNKFKYLNYAASWQKPITGYGEANVRRLQAASKEYDATGLFQDRCPGGFKVFRS